jgi:hypothetical protein
MSDTEEGVAAAAVEVEEEYEAPEVHMMDGTPKFNEEGAAYYTTQCGKTINEEALSITDDADSVTCSACKGA